MRGMKLGILALGIVLAAAPARAQDLVSVIPTLYGPGGLTVDSTIPAFHGFTHHAHFASSFLNEFQAFNEAFASQIASEPLPSPASGFTYTFDASLGVFKRSTQSFGPILSDRSETIGKGKFSFGFNFQHFDFDSINGVDLHALPAVLTHVHFPVTPAPFFTYDVITLNNDISSTVDQYTAFVSYGLSSRLDFSLAVPIERVSLSVSSVATINPLGSTFPGTLSQGALGAGTHFFSARYPGTAIKSANASGVGDLLLRLKGRAAEWGSAGIGLGVDVRLPTGDEKNLLGTGAVGVKPFAIFSYAGQNFSPHLKVAYQWNGQSYLGVGGNAATVQDSGGNAIPLKKGDMPKELFFEGGADFAITKWFTLAADYLGRRFFNTTEDQAFTFQAPDPGGTIHPLPDTQTLVGDFTTSEGSVGIKLNPGGNLLIDANVLFNLDHNGLHHKPTPLIGIEYAF